MTDETAECRSETESDVVVLKERAISSGDVFRATPWMTKGVRNVFD